MTLRTFGFSEFGFLLSALQWTIAFDRHCAFRGRSYRLHRCTRADLATQGRAGCRRHLHPDHPGHSRADDPVSFVLRPQPRRLSKCRRWSQPAFR